MTGTRSWLRAGLVLLSLTQGVTGLWMLLSPRSFYDNVLGVSALPPFNEHLMRDLGGVYLALAVVLDVGAIRLERSLVRTALAAYLVASVTHLHFHATHGAGLTGSATTALLASLVLLVLLSAALLILARRLPGRSPTSGRIDDDQFS